MSPHHKHTIYPTFLYFQSLPYLPYSVSVHHKWLHIIHCIILYLHITSILQCHIPSLYITSDLHILHCHTLCLRIYHMCSSHPTSQVFYISYIVITRVLSYIVICYVSTSQRLLITSVLQIQHCHTLDSCQQPLNHSLSHLLCRSL